MTKKYEYIEIAAKLAAIVLMLALVFGCKSIEYRDRPPHSALNGGCQIPRAQAKDTVKDVLVYVEDLKLAMCSCDSRIREATGEPISERMKGVCEDG